VSNIALTAQPGHLCCRQFAFWRLPTGHNVGNLPFPGRCGFAKPAQEAFGREVAARFGLVPNFFRSASDAPFVVGPGTKVTPVRRQSMANLFDQTPEEPRPVWMPVPPVFEQKPKPKDDDAEGYGLPQIQNRPLRF
jgi:hypothetical protein